MFTGHHFALLRVDFDGRGLTRYLININVSGILKVFRHNKMPPLLHVFVDDQICDPIILSISGPQHQGLARNGGTLGT